MHMQMRMVKSLGDIFFMNPLMELRKRQGLSRREMGELLGVEVSTVEKYESDPPEETARKYLDLTRKWGQHDLVPSIRRMTDERPQKASLNPEGWTEHERELLAGLLDLLRDPETETERALPKFLADTLDFRKTRRNKKKPASPLK